MMTGCGTKLGRLQTSSTFIQESQMEPVPRIVDLCIELLVMDGYTIQVLLLVL